ncbi:MAG TPA: hypothetical protein VI299_23160, partial [Polyangiales bacterium]
MRSLRLLSLAVSVYACGPEEPAKVTLPIQDECDGFSDRVLCSGGSALTCSHEDVVERLDCQQMGLICALNAGCRVCKPDGVSCDGSARYRCSADGNTRTLLETCSDGLQCSAEGCRDLCADAAKDRSYLGCEYWPVFTSNRELPAEFFPAISIGNGNLVPAHVSITRGGAPITELDVPPESATTV